jgi:hypothetical protein
MKGDYLAAAMKLMPRFMQDINKSLGLVGTGVTEQKKTVSGKEYGEESGIGGAIGQALGFTPASQAQQYEYGGSGYEYKQEQKAKKERNAKMNEYLNAEPREQRRIWRETIQPFNRGKKGKDKITMGDLVRNKKRRATEAKKQKLEERIKRRQGG